MPMVPLSGDELLRRVGLHGEPAMTTLDLAPDTRDTARRRGEDQLTANDWSTPRHFGALRTVDHKIIGRRYIITAFVFLALGGRARAC